MLETVATHHDAVSIKATVRKVAVYLDNYSIIDLAKGNAERRDRMIQAFRQGADLLFSPMNAAEIIGPECQSSLDAVRSFLDAIGPHWFPVEGDVMSVIEREASGTAVGRASVSQWFMSQFFAGRNIQVYGEQRLHLVEPEFFRLSFVLDWLQPQREDIRQKVADFEERLSDRLAQLRRAYEFNRPGFEQLLPCPRFDTARPATFAWNGLLRLLVLEAKGYRFKRGDGTDLCHAITAAAFAGFATLDKQWKRRITSLPKPNGLAKIYYAPELDRLVADLESALAC